MWGFFWTSNESLNTLGRANVIRRRSSSRKNWKLKESLAGWQLSRILGTVKKSENSFEVNGILKSLGVQRKPRSSKKFREFLRTLLVLRWKKYCGSSVKVWELLGCLEMLGVFYS